MKFWWRRLVWWWLRPYRLFGVHWHEDCIRWRGEILTGRYIHWCFDWDELPVDETTFEWNACSCFRDYLGLRNVKGPEPNDPSYSEKD